MKVEDDDIRLALWTAVSDLYRLLQMGEAGPHGDVVPVILEGSRCIWTGDGFTPSADVIFSDEAQEFRCNVI